ncbi:hypothetical protein G6F43_004692 [Rhizopus delemar]|nr:hypothetical protein G6F43_004692 [Rhizopus delemar]
MKFTIAATALTLATAVSAFSPCVKEVVAKADDTCNSIASSHGIPTADFLALNADVACDKLVAGEAYCVQALPKHDKRDSYTGHKIALAKKKASKKGKKTTKKGKKTTKKAKKTTKKGKKTTKKTTKSSSNSKASQSRPGDNWSSTPKNAPSNAVRHIISTCNKYSTVKSSDSWCGDFSKRNGITTTQLYDWNAGLHRSGSHECDNLDDGRAYCVGISH